MAFELDWWFHFSFLINLSMFFTAHIEFSSYPSFEAQRGRWHILLMHANLWVCCLCLCPEVWFSLHRAYAIILYSWWEERKYKLLLFWLYTYFSVGKCHGTDKVMNSFNCVLWYPCHTVSVEHWSGHWCVRSEESCCSGSRLYSLSSFS